MWLRRVVALVAFTVALPAAASQKVYESHFDKGAGAEWSSQETARPPRGERTFLGPLLNDPVALDLKDLPKHGFVRVSFDLLILLSWDGNGRQTLMGDVVGPDCWRCSLADGRTLMWHTFSTTPNERGFAAECMFQSYPSPVPGESCKANTGAAEVNTLGYVMRAGPGFPMDAVYRVTMTFPHAENALGMSFCGYGLQPPSKKYTNGRMDEGWALDRVTVEVLGADEVRQCDTGEAVALLSAAADGSDPVKAGQAYVSLLTGGEAVRKVMAEAMTDAGWKPKLVARLVKDMASADPSVREWAGKELEYLGAVAEPVLWGLTREGNPPEVRGAAMAMIRRMPAAVGHARRRGAVAARVLGVIGGMP